ncbi:MAG: hypothetical protein LBL13_10565 [Bacteroidales bacterium]|nr:hypothetical protein [Bacteroidales bacterium]
MKINKTMLKQTTKHIPSLTGRNVFGCFCLSTNMLSLTGQEIQQSCPVRDKMLVGQNYCPPL